MPFEHSANSEKLASLLERIYPSAKDLENRLRETSYFKELQAELPEEKLRKMFRDMEDRERRFAEKVFVAVEKAHSRFSEGTALFDIDETLARTRVAGGGAARHGEIKYNTIVRPAASHVLEYIKDAGFSIGFITTRGPSEDLLNQALNDPKNLSPLKNYINPARIYSTKDQRVREEKIKTDCRGMDSEREKFFDYLLRGALVRPDCTDSEKSELVSSGVFEKMLTLSAVKREFDENTALIVADDLAYPLALNEEGGLYGVELHWTGGDSAAFTLDKEFIEV